MFVEKKFVMSDIEIKEENAETFIEYMSKTRKIKAVPKKDPILKSAEVKGNSSGSY